LIDSPLHNLCVLIELRSTVNIIEDVVGRDER